MEFAKALGTQNVIAKATTKRRTPSMSEKPPKPANPQPLPTPTDGQWQEKKDPKAGGEKRG
jgi:hypothetical protein